MLIPVNRIPWEGLDLDGAEPDDVLGLDNEADHLRPLGPIKYHLQARIVSQEVLVHGRLEVPVDFCCSRCAEFFALTVKEPNFQGIYPFTDQHTILDLTCDLRESIILAFPSFPVCSETCRGLCPQCGSNRNRTACACAMPAPDTRWAALDQLSLRKDSGSKN